MEIPATQKEIQKRNINKLVNENLVSGYSDPRLLTIKGLRRRGFTPNSIKEFCERISVTRKDGVVSYSLLEECLRIELNKTAPRLMGVMDPVKLVVTNWDGSNRWCEVDNNPEDENSGKRKVSYCSEFWIEREDFREEAINILKFKVENIRNKFNLSSQEELNMLKKKIDKLNLEIKELKNLIRKR